MAQQTINVGTAPNDGTGTPLRTAFQYTNSNFSELYTAVGPSGNNIVVPGNATISGDLTVDTSTLKVDSANNRVGIGTASPANQLSVRNEGASGIAVIDVRGGSAGAGAVQISGNATTLGTTSFDLIQNSSGAFVNQRDANPLSMFVNGSERYAISSSGVATWSNVGGVAGTAMTLNSTGLGVGGSPATKLDVRGATNASQATFSGTAGRGLLISTRSDSLADDRTVILNAQFATGSLGQLVIQTAGTDRLLVDSSGNVGIGVTPSAWATYKAIQIGSGGGGFLYGFATSEVGIGNSCYYNAGWKYLTNTDKPCWFSSAAGAFYWNTANTGTAGNAITFTQAMTLTAAGDLLVGTTTNTNSSRIFARGTASAPSVAMQGATGDVAMPGLVVGKFDNNSTTSQIFAQFTINNAATGSGQINANGASQAAFGSYSDSRLKENIVSLPSQLANILSLRPVEFDYKDGSGHQIGFVAQEMQEVYSDAVGEQNGFLTVTGWSKTEARLVSAIKELAAKVQALEAKLA